MGDGEKCVVPKEAWEGESLTAWRTLAGGPALSGGRWRRRRRDKGSFPLSVQEDWRLGLNIDGLWWCGKVEKACCLPWIFP